MTSSVFRDHQPEHGRRHYRFRSFVRKGCWAFLLGAHIAVTPMSASADPIGRTLLATPLVLKDGRIAEVAVHTIPFPDDAIALAENTKSALDDFARRIATDCFLTAQVIGHVDKGEIGGRETAEIHRLARARADTIQGTLIDSGLPATSIASVWDWRFLVQEARATLWVFRLTTGDDCEDQPLGGDVGDKIAADDRPEPPSINKTSSASTPAHVPAKVDASPPASTKPAIVPASRPKAASLTASIPPSPTKHAGERSPETAHSSAPAAGEDPSRETTVAAHDPAATVFEAEQTGADSSVEIVFATNSSYFPNGAGDQLRAFLKTLSKDKRYVLRIQTSVASSADVSGVSESEAVRYNGWLAERRAKRVEEWLQKNGKDFNFTLKPSLVENDGSRRVRIDANPLG